MNTKYLVLDANVIYNYLGRKKLGLSSHLEYNEKRLSCLLDKSVLFISTSVLTEVLVHFRNDLEKIKELIVFLHNKISYVLTASTDCADEKTIDFIVRAKNDNERTIILNEVLKSKIAIEVYFAYVFAWTISAIIGEMLIEEKIKKSSIKGDKTFYSEKAMTEIVSNRERMLNSSKQELLSYYNVGKENSGMKRIYTNFLSSCFKEYEKQLFEITRKEDCSREIDEEAFYESLELSSNPDKMNQTIARLSSVFKKQKHYKQLIEEKITIVTSGWSHFDRWQKTYIASRFEYYISDTTKFKKNDVFDTLFLGALKDESIKEINKNCVGKKMPKCTRDNYHLLSFDKDVSYFIYVHDWKGALIIDRLRRERLFPDTKPDFAKVSKTSKK